MRDPLERLLSAYLDKCVGGTRGDSEVTEAHRQQHCTSSSHRAALLDSPTPRAGFAALVRHLATRADAGDELCGENQHFAPQACFCGWLAPPVNSSRAAGAVGGRKADGMAARYHHVLRMTSSTFVEDTHALLRTVGLGQLATVFLPTFTAGVGHRTNASKKLRLYYTPTVARAALRALRIDYEAFDLPRPAWLASLGE